MFTVTRRFIQGRSGQRSDVVPMLRMSGHWLSACGFDTGVVVSVCAKKGRLVITTVHRRERSPEQHVIAEPSHFVMPKPEQPSHARALPRLAYMRLSLRRVAARRGGEHAGASASACGA